MYNNIRCLVLKDLSAPESDVIANCRLSQFDGNVIKRILVSKQMITNKDEQAFVSNYKLFSLIIKYLFYVIYNRLSMLKVELSSILLHSLAVKRAVNGC